MMTSDVLGFVVPPPALEGIEPAIDEDAAQSAVTVPIVCRRAESVKLHTS